jgi:RND family efflux transporter MFP subunit
MTHPRSLTLAFSVLLAAAATLAGCRGAPEPEAAAPGASIDLETTVATTGSLPLTVEAGGLVQAAVTASVTSRLVADVRAVHVAAGDRVSRGQALVTLDDRDVTSLSAQTEAGVTAARHAQAAAAADRAAAEAAMSLAELTHERIATLHGTRAATTHELDQASSALRAARARLAAADARLTEVAAVIAAAEATREGALVARSHAVLRAPFNGVVAHVAVDPGNQVAPGVVAVRVESLERRVDVSLDATRASTIEVGQQVEVLVDERPHAITGTIGEIAQTVEGGLQSVRLKVALPVDTDLPSGRFVRVRLAGPVRDVLLVPESAVARRGQLTAVFVVDAGRLARLRLVSIGTSVGGRTEIVSGLEPGETVITAPPADLRDGTLLTQGARR